MEDRFYSICLCGVLWLLVLSTTAQHEGAPRSIFAYDYEADMRVQTNDPAPYLSQFKLKGLLFLSVDQDDYSLVQLKFENMKFSMYNGDNRRMQYEEDTYYEIENEKDSFYNSFFIKKSKNQSSATILFDGQEDQLGQDLWSENFKRGVASFIHIDYDTLKQSSFKKRFAKEEDTVYGRCHTEYSIEPSGSKVFLTKVQNLNNCSRSVIKHFSFPNSIYSLNLEPVLSSSIKSYKIKEIDDGRYQLLSATSDGQIQVSPYDTARGNDWFVIMKQEVKLIPPGGEIYDLISKIDFQQDFHNLNLREHNINYQKSTHDFVGGYPTKKMFHIEERCAKGLPDIISAFIQCNGFIKTVIQELDAVTANWNENSMAVEDTNIDKMKGIQKALSSLRQLDSNSFHALSHAMRVSNYSKERWQTLYKLLPFVGTDTSVLMMCDFFKSSEIDYATFANMLIHMPFYVVNCNAKFLNSFERCFQKVKDVFVRENVGVDMRYLLYVFLMAYGTLMNQANDNRYWPLYRFDLFYHEELVKQGKIEKTMLWLDLVKNVGDKDVIAYLNSTVVNDKSLPPRLRLKAFTLPPRITSKADKDLVFNIYMPVLIDKEECLTVRAGALDMLLQIQMNAANWRNALTVHWHMSTEGSTHLYNYYYSYIKQLSMSINPQHKSMRDIAKTLFQIMRIPSKAPLASSVTIYNYADEASNGEEIIVKSIADPLSTHLIQFEINTFSTKRTVNVKKLQIELEGVNTKLMNDLMSKIHETVPLDILDFDNVLNNIKNITPEFYYSIIVEKNGYIILKVDSTQNNSMLAPKGIPGYLLENELFDYTFYEEDKHLVTDIGVPAVITRLFPNDVMLKMGIIQPYPYFGMGTTSYKERKTGEVKLSVHNPFADSWHSIVHSQTFAMQIPIMLRYRFEAVAGFELDIINGREYGGYLGIEHDNRIYTTVDIFDEKFSSINITKKAAVEKVRSLPKEPITYDLSPLGYKLKFTQDCKTRHGKLNSLWSSPWNHLFKKAWTLLVPHLPTPNIENCNFQIVAVPTGGSSKISVKLSVNGEFTDLHPLPGYKEHILGEVSLSGDDQDKTISYTFSTDNYSSSNKINTTMATRMKYTVGGVSNGNALLINISKVFPPIGADAFQYGWGDETVRTTLNVSCETGECMQLSFNILGEISDEQKRIAKSDVYPYSQCKKDQSKPEWQGPLLPRTWACYEGAIKLFYTRKVSLNLNYKNVPGYLQSLTNNLSNSVKYYLNDYVDSLTAMEEGTAITSDGCIQMVFLHAATKPKFDLHIITPYSNRKYKDVPGIDRDMYNIQLDSTHFSKSIQFLESTAIVRSCIANSVSVLTPDNKTVPHNFGWEYDLLSGAVFKKYAVLAKKTESGMVGKILVGNASLELSTDGANLNGKLIENLEEGYQYPVDDPNYTFRIWSNQGQITVISRKLLFYVIHSPISITLDQPIIYKGFVSGLCGDLDIKAD